MNTMRPTRWWPRYQAELAASGEAGIRDRDTDVLHRAASIGDAHVDADYLTAQWRAGNDAEVARHLAFLAEQASSGRGLRSAAPPRPEPQRVLDAATAWESARLESEAASAERARTRVLTSLRRSIESAASEAHLAGAAVVDAIGQLYADPLAAQRVLSDTSESVPLPALAGLVRSEPTVFGPLAEPSARRFGPTAARLEVTNRTERLAAALENQAQTAIAFETAFAAAAAAVQADPATSADDLARALADRSRAETASPARDPHHHLARATNHLRALLAAADEKTTAAVVHRFPTASTVAREARAHSSSLAPDL